MNLDFYFINICLCFCFVFKRDIFIEPLFGYTHTSSLCHCALNISTIIVPCKLAQLFTGRLLCEARSASLLSVHMCVWKTWLKMTVYDHGNVFSVHLLEANRIRPKGFHVLCSHSPWGNDVKLKELVSLSKFKMIMKDVRADSLTDGLFFVWLKSISARFLFLLMCCRTNALRLLAL